MFNLISYHLLSISSTIREKTVAKSLIVFMNFEKINIFSKLSTILKLYGCDIDTSNRFLLRRWRTQQWRHQYLPQNGIPRVNITESIFIHCTNKLDRFIKTQLYYKHSSFFEQWQYKVLGEIPGQIWAKMPIDVGICPQENKVPLFQYLSLPRRKPLRLK